MNDDREIILIPPDTCEICDGPLEDDAITVCRQCQSEFGSILR